MDSKKQAEGIASLGRFGDTTLMHMRPDEVEQLTAISRANGGDITINPKTGMPEAFLGDFVGALLPTAAGLGAGALFGPAGGAIAGGLTSFMQGKRDPLSIGLGALGGYGGAQIGSQLSAVGTPSAQVGSQIGASNLTNAAVNTQGFNPALVSNPVPAGAGTNIGSPALTSAGGRGITTAPQPFADTTLGPNMNRVEMVPRDAGFNYALDESFNNQLPDIQPDPNAVSNLPALQEKTPFQEGYEYAQDKFSTLGRGAKAVATDPAKRSEFFSKMGGGNETYGMMKTALPAVGAGAEAYMKGYYEDMPQPEDDRRRYYDPTRVLDLGGDTGLRLLAKGGKVAFADGGEAKPLSYYGIEPQYQTRMVTDQFGMSRPAPAIGAPYYGGPLAGNQSNQVRVPVTGFVDVGGKFKADPKGDITDVEYEKRFSYVTEGVGKQDDEGSNFDSVAGGAGGAGMNPLAALKVAQGYADAQQSDTASTGLGGLKKGGKIHYKKGGDTTAEQTTAKTATPAPATTADMLAAKKLAEEEGANAIAGIGGLQNMIPESVNLDAIKAQLGGGMADGGVAELTPDDGKMLNGMGDGVSDDIPAMIEGQQEAALSDGEFIVPARIVSELGNGSSDAGAKKLYSMIDRIQAARKQTIGDNKEYAKDTNAERFMPA